jgi:PAS domain S-box-containing protein
MESLSTTDGASDRLHASFSQLFERSPMPMWVYDVATLDLIAGNLAALACYGYSQSDFLRLKLTDLFAPSDWPRLMAFLQLPADQRAAHRLTQHRHRNGHAIDVEVDTEDIELDGMHARMVMVRVMTQQRLAEREQLQLAQRLTFTLESISDGFFLLDAQRCFSYINRSAEAIWRINRYTLLGCNIWERFPGLVESRFYEEYERVFATGGSATFEAYYEPLDQWCEVQAFAADGGVNVFFRDITQRRAAQLTLARERETLAAVVNATADAIVGVDAAGQVIMFNPSAERVFGRSRESLQEVGLSALLPEKFRLAHEAHVAGFAAQTSTDALTLPRMMGLGGVKGLRADGQVLDLEGSISAVNVGQDKILIASLRDMTERNRAEAERQRIRTQLSALTHKLMTQEKNLVKSLAQTLHDQLGQTLAAIRMAHETLLVLQGTERSPDLQRMDQHLGLLIRQAVKQVRQALVDLHPPLLDEQGLAAALDNELRNRALTRQDVRIVLHATPAIARVRWPAEIEFAAFMVAREAVENALRHAQPTTLTVQLTGRGHMLKLEVLDDGKGLPEGAVPFRPGHLGMTGMNERARGIGASLEVAPHPAGGTRVCLSWRKQT